MKQKLFLSSMLIMSVAPAFAETFPTNGLMQENTTYTNAATETNMAGVYEGTVDATAEYENILYNIVAGNYLPGGSEDVNGTQCTPGNFCTGLTNATYSESDQGLTSCSTLGDGSYTLSPAGATNGNMCYKTCSASCTNPTAPAHSTNVSYGNETSNGTWNYGSTCNAVAPTCSINFDCVNGYHKRPDLTKEEAIALYKQMAKMQGENPDEIPQEYIESEIDNIFDNWESLPDEVKKQTALAIAMYKGNVDLSFLQPFSNVYDEIKNNSNNRIEVVGYSYSKRLSDGTEICQTVNTAYIAMLSGGQSIDCTIAAQQNAELAQFRQTAQNGDWFFILPEKNISMSGHSRCDSSYVYGEGTTPCKMAMSTINNVSANADLYQDDACIDPWSTNYDENDRCEDYCAGRNARFSIFVPMILANYQKENLTPSEEELIQIYALFADVNSVKYMCDANTININWLGADDEDISANNAGTAKYDGDIRTPVKAQTIKGKTFKGWRFSKPTETNLPE